MNFENYKYKLEAHAHSKPGSRCSEIPVKDVVDIYDKLGYSTLVLTNHFNPDLLEYDKKTAVKNYLYDYNEAVKYAEDKNINVILGIEIRFTENYNDYLVYGIDEKFVEKSYDYIDGTLEKFYRNMKNDKNVILQAHPFRKDMTLMPAEFIDGIETFNMHPGQNGSIATACKYALMHKDMLICGGTDYHHPTHEGSISINTKSIIKDSFQFADILKSKDFIFDISGNIVIPYGFKEN